jgi:hypothetical protein
MTWNEDEKYPREWEDESVYPSLLHWKADCITKFPKVGFGIVDSAETQIR